MPSKIPTPNLNRNPELAPKLRRFGSHHNTFVKVFGQSRKETLLDQKPQRRSLRSSNMERRERREPLEPHFQFGSLLIVYRERSQQDPRSMQLKLQNSEPPSHLELS